MKGQSNSVIAGSLRNLFGQDLGASRLEVEHWMGKGVDRLPTPTKLQMPVDNSGRQPPGDNVRRRKGKNPDRQLRPPNDG